METESAEVLWLGRYSTGELSVERPLLEKEAEDVLRAQEFVSAFSAWEWNSVQPLARELLQETQEFVFATNRAGGVENQAQLALIATLAERLFKSVSKFLKNPRLGGEADDEHDETLWLHNAAENEVLLEVRSDAISGHAVWLTSGPTSPIVSAIKEAVWLSESAAAEVLSSHRGELKESARLLLRLEAEVVVGNALLLTQSVVDEINSGGEFSMDLDFVDTHRARQVYESSLRADALMRDREANDEAERAVDDASVPSCDGSDVPTEPTEPTTVEEDTPFAPADLTLLLDEASELSTEMQKAWSDALIGVLESNFQEIKSRWSGVNRRIAGAAMSLATEAQVVTTEEIDVSPEGDAVSAQALQAVAVVLPGLLQEVGRLDHPGSLTVEFADGVQTSRGWWSAGGLERISSLARLPARLLAVASPANSKPEWIAQFELASSSIESGLTEAACLHLWLTVNQLITARPSLEPSLSGTLSTLDLWRQEVDKGRADVTASTLMAIDVMRTLSELIQPDSELLQELYGR